LVEVAAMRCGVIGAPENSSPHSSQFGQDDKRWTVGLRRFDSEVEADLPN
jgi:hypothetical protein